ncbi:MAG: MFS transporter [Myxococcales bacterium]
MTDAQADSPLGLWGMTRYQWTVLFAAWLGWGFDVFDGLLFNYVAPNCVPVLLGLPLGSLAAKQATLFWGGTLTSILLLGWAAGGIIFGAVADRIGRTRTLLITMLLYALGTAACAAAPNLPVLILFRLVASLGIGGEWAAGASMVAEVVPERRRVEAGALLYTSAPMGLFLATFVNFQIAGNLFKGSPETSWRYVFLCGLIPAAAAFVIRLFVREPERWKQAAAGVAPPRMRELFAPNIRALTLSGFLMALVALITWWSTNAFIPIVSTGLAQAAAKTRGLDRAATMALVESWKAYTTSYFNLGGLIGTLLTIPASKLLGRKKMFALYYALSGLALFATFHLDLTPEVRMRLYFFDGLTVFGVFGAFTYYLPELFPTRLRATGAGFCYNVGRILTAAGPFLVGHFAARGRDALTGALSTLSFVAIVPIAGLLFMPLVIETKGRALE